MPLKTKIRWVECPDKNGVRNMALTAKQKKLPKALQASVRKNEEKARMVKRKRWKEKKKQRYMVTGFNTFTVFVMFVPGVIKLS